MRLIDDLGDTGSIVVYSSFEKTMIRGLAERFPEYEQALQGIEERLFDLEPVVRKGYIHPEFGGRTSIKVVVPVLAPDLSYEGLEIGDGDSAVAAFAAMAKGEMGKDETERVRKALLGYCKVDTLAMVRVHHALAESCR